jgi:hypothetical protein
LATGVAAGSAGIYASNGSVHSNMAVLTVSRTSRPAFTIVSPADGAVLANPAIMVSGTVSDTMTVTSVQLQIDGVDFGPPLFAPPYQWYWDTIQRATGRHNLQLVATYPSGDSAVSSPITVTAQTPEVTPIFQSCYVYPNPALRGEAPTIRVSLSGGVDSLEVTIFNAAGRPVNSGSLSETRSGIYEYTWSGGIASGAYYAVVRGKGSDGTPIRTKTKFAVVR